MQNNVTSILKFNLDSEEGRDAHLRACKAEQAYRSLSEIQKLLGKYDKYGMPQKDYKSVEDIFEKVSVEINEIIIGNGIDLSEEYK